MISPTEAERTLQQTARIAGRLGHDFGNYLTSILGFTELAVKQLPEDSLSSRYLQEVWQAAMNGANWVQRLLFLNRGKPAHFLPANLITLVREEESRLQPLWKKAVVFTTALELALPLVDVDKESLQHLLTQLLNNAREAIGDQGTVTLSARTVSLGDGQELLECCGPGNFVEITIADTGEGLPPQMRQQVDTGPLFSTKPCHRGLGLLTVSWIAQLFRGGFRLVPREEQGTTAQLLLPAAPLPSPDPGVKISDD